MYTVEHDQLGVPDMADEANPATTPLQPTLWEQEVRRLRDRRTKGFARLDDYNGESEDPEERLRYTIAWRSKQMGITFQALFEAAGVPVTTLEGFMRRKSRVKFDDVDKVLSQLGLEVSFSVARQKG
jgi:hypothetical protein